jgi:protein gp37
MAENSKIAWTDATFNPWMGCAKISEGCAHCYAEADNVRYGRRDLWGPDAPRQRTSENYWKQPLKWNAAAEKAGERRRVFCGSWCDVMEAGVYLDAIRSDLYSLIEETTWLDWLLLTKRAENFGKLLPKAWLKTPRPNVWLMTTIENDRHYDRAEALIEIPAVVHGLSLEPLLGSLRGLPLTHIEWAIVGGESGPGARPCDPQGIRSVVRQCREAKVPCFVKQVGSVPIVAACRQQHYEWGEGNFKYWQDERSGMWRVTLKDHKGADPAEWPEDLRVRQMPEVTRA